MFLFVANRTVKCSVRSRQGEIPSLCFYPYIQVGLYMYSIITHSPPYFRSSTDPPSTLS